MVLGRNESARPAADDLQPQAEPSPSEARASDPLAPRPTVPESITAAPAAASPAPAIQALPGRTRGSLLAAGCAVIALAAACVTLAAPQLRPIVIAESNSLLGSGNPVAGWLTEDDAARRDLAALLPRIADLDTDVRAMRARLTQVETRLAETATQLHEGLGSIETIARTAEESNLRVRRIDEASQVLTARIRAAILVSAAARLRRDVDTGIPLDETIGMLTPNGPFPEPVAQAVQTVRQSRDGVPTMRDLGLGYEALEARIVAQTAQTQPQGFGRVWAWFAGRGPDPVATVLDRLHMLAAEGRFSEAATLLERSPWRQDAAEWIAQARARTSTVQAVRTITAYAVEQVQAPANLSKGQ